MLKDRTKVEKKIFIGLAWPYANGSLHLGHAAAFIGADILARYFRLKGDKVLFVSGSDCYGTPIAVEAVERGISPIQIADKYHSEFVKTLIEGLNFSYDIYTRTTTEYHSKVVQELFLQLFKKGYLYTKSEEALYSPFLKRFLPDRYIIGICPICKAADARGDQCDECGELLNPLDLIDPQINPKILKNERKLTSKDFRLEKRKSEHFYLRLSKLQNELEGFVSEKGSLWRANAKGFAKGFLQKGLHDRAITRDTNWGVSIPIPGYEEKRIYVWFEAVAGYLSASKLWAEESGNDGAWEEFWKNDQAIHYYVHGKDNIPFHTIIWPAILLAEGSLHMPDYIISSEYLTLEGRQFSKSRSWAVWLPDFLDEFDGELLRYFLTVNGPETGDADFTWEEFATKVNGELISTVGNLVNRVFVCAFQYFPEGIKFADNTIDEDSRSLLEQCEASFLEVGQLIEKGKFRAAFNVILALAQNGNRFVNQKEPWKKIKELSLRSEVGVDLAVLLHVIYTLGILINPFLPQASKKVLSHFVKGNSSFAWEYPKRLDIYKVSEVTALFKKITPDEIESQYKKLNKPGE